MRAAFVLVPAVLLVALVIGLLGSDGPSSPPLEERATAPRTEPAARLAGNGTQAASNEEEGDEAEAFDLQGFPSLEAWIAHHRPRRLEGRVVDAAGDAVRGAVVWVVSSEDAEPPLTYSDTDGRFRLTLPLPDHLPGGTYRIAARGPDDAVGGVDVGVAGSYEEQDVGDVRLDDGGAIRGRVVDGTGRGLDGVRVRAYDEAGPVLETFENGRHVLIGTADGRTDAEGRFALRGLLPHPHWVRVELLLAPGSRVEPKDVRGVYPGGDELTFTLVPRAKVAGRVFDAQSGEAVPHFVLNGVPHADAAGRFTVDLPPDGSLHVLARGYRPRHLDDLQLREGDRLPAIDVAMVPDPDVGTLVVVGRDPDGREVTGFEAHGTGPDFAPWTEASGDGASELSIAGLVPGPHQLWVFGAGLQAVPTSATVEVGVERRVVVVLRRGGIVALRVLDETGAVARDLGLEVLDAEGARIPYRFVYDEAAGTLLAVTEVWGSGRQQLASAAGRLEGLAAGDYVLRLHGPGDSRAFRDVSLRVPAAGLVQRTVSLAETDAATGSAR